MKAPRGNSIYPDSYYDYCEVPGGTGSCPTHDKNTGKSFRDAKMCYTGCDAFVCTASQEYPEAHHFCKHGKIWGSRSI